VQPQELGVVKQSNDLIRSRNRDLSACSLVPQPTTIPRAPSALFLLKDLSDHISLNLLLDTNKLTSFYSSNKL
jgi:hypothetical protein